MQDASFKPVTKKRRPRTDNSTTFKPPNAQLRYPTLSSASTLYGGRDLDHHVAQAQAAGTAAGSTGAVSASDALLAAGVAEEERERYGGGMDQSDFPDAAPFQFDNQGISDYGRKIEARAQRWREMREELLRVFLERSGRTRHFTQDEPDSQPPCSTCAVLTMRLLVVDLDSRYPLNVNYCACQASNKAARLMGISLLPSSPTRPHLTFTLRLIRLLDSIWGSSPFGFDGMSKGLERAHRDAGYRFLTRGGKDMSTRLPLQSAMDEYRSLLRAEVDELNNLAGFSERELVAATCPACFGPRDEETERRAGKTATDFDAIVCLDGNFQQSRDTHAKYDPQKVVPALFLDKDYVEETGRLVSATSAKDLHACSDSWKAADDGKAGSFVGKVDTGLVGCVCRHDFLLKLVNLVKTGEKQYFAVSLLRWLTEIVDDKASIGVLYDIACNLSRHVVVRDLLPLARTRLGFATSVFHAYAHVLSCQVRYNPRYIERFGLSDGEGCERTWSFMRPLISLNRSASSSHRFINLDKRTSVGNEEKLRVLPTALLRRQRRTLHQERNARAMLAEIQRDSPSLTDEVLRAHWRDQQAVVSGEGEDDRTATLSKRKRLVELWAQKREVEEALSAAQVSLSNPALQYYSQQAVKIYQTRLLKLRELEAEVKVEAVALGGRQTLQKLRKLVLERRLVLQPLLDVRRGGRGARLGMKKSQALITKVKKSTSALTTAAKHYNTAVNAYKTARPQLSLTSPRLPSVPDLAPEKASQLLDLDPMGAFFTDSFFIYRDQPWATDAAVRDGIDYLQRRDRAEEEQVRLQCEVFCQAKWALARTERLMALYEKATTADPPPPVASSGFHALVRATGRHQALLRAWLGGRELQNALLGVIPDERREKEAGVLIKSLLQAEARLAVIENAVDTWYEPSSAAETDDEEGDETDEEADEEEAERLEAEEHWQALDSEDRAGEEDSDVDDD
ncbi:hypothetical protein JCM11641_004341 [Rhodosporidiobolus odoratus]